MKSRLLPAASVLNAIDKDENEVMPIGPVQGFVDAFVRERLSHVVYSVPLDGCDRGRAWSPHVSDMSPEAILTVDAKASCCVLRSLAL